MRGVRFALGAVSSGLMALSMPFITGSRLCVRGVPVLRAPVGITAADSAEQLAQDDSNNPQYAAPQGDDNSNPDNPDQPNAQPGDSSDDSSQTNSPGAGDDSDSSQMNAGQDQSNDNPDQSNSDSSDSQNEQGNDSP